MKKASLYLVLFLLTCNQHIDAKRYNYSYDLSIAAIFRNEAAWLKEWIEYHLLIGVQHFYLYNNLSKDNYNEVLSPYVERGIVELYEWPYESKDTPHWTQIQTNAYNDAIKRSKGVSRWLAVLDTDEFVVPIHQYNLMEFLRNYENYGGVAIHWQMFGTSNVEKIPEGKLMIETLIWKAADDYGENAFIKTIFHPEHVKKMNDPHKPEYKAGRFSVNSRKERVGKNSTNRIFDLEYIRINHYWTRDWDYFYNFKRPRREKWLEGFDGQLARANSLNHHIDHFILRFVPELRKRMGLGD